MSSLCNRLTNIRNGSVAQLAQILFTRPQGSISNHEFAVLNILRKRGRIRAFYCKEVIVANKLITQYTVYLKYDSTGKPVIDSIFVVSKPSRRVYLSSAAL